MKYRSLTSRTLGPAFLGLVALVTISSVHGDTILPAGNFACTPSGGCSGSATQLPSVNGVQGVEFDNLTGSSPNSTSAEFVFDTSGLVSGLGIPSGSLIPYSFSFTADSTQASGTMIDSVSFHPDSNQAFTNTQQSTVVFNNFCTPLTDTHWCETVQGTGLITFTSAIPSGASLELSGDFTIQAHSTLGAPTIGLQGQVDFNPVPEPRYTSIILLFAGAAVAWVRRSRAGKQLLRQL